jgi:myo-inositol catabolism protein IolH
MRISVDTCIHFSLVSPRDAIRMAKEAGYDWIEYARRPDFDLAQVKGWLREFGVRVDTVMLGPLLGSADEAVRRQAVAEITSLFQLGMDLDCRHFGSELNGPPGSEACRAAFLRSMEDLLPTIEREDLQVSFECHPGDFIEESNATVDLLRQVGSKHVGYLFCTPHTFTMGGDVQAMVEYAGPTITHVHIADSFKEERIIKDPPNLRVRTHLHLKPGLGEVDWSAFFRALNATGYDQALSVVAFSHRFDRAFETAKETREWLRQYVG